MAAVGEIVRADLSYTQGGASEILNVLYWVIQATNGDDDDLLSDLVTWATDEWAANWAVLGGVGTSLDTISVNIVDAAGLVLRNIGTGIINVNGADLSDAGGAAQAAYLMADTVFPKVRGAKYIPGISSGNINNGIIVASALVELALLLDTWVSTVVGAASTLDPGVVSKSQSSFVPFSQSGAVEQIPAYQRRRKSGVGS